MALSILVVFLVPTGLAKAVEHVAPYSSFSDTPFTSDIRTDKDLLAHLVNYRPGIITNSNGNEGNDTEARLKGNVMQSNISSPAVSSSIASLFDKYFGSTAPSDNNTGSDDPVPNISPFSTSTLFETLSILTTYSNNNVIMFDLTHILGFDPSRIGIGIGGQLPSGLQIPLGAMLDNSLNPISYFFTFTIRF
jgi:hypothetical protein